MREQPSQDPSLELATVKLEILPEDEHDADAVAIGEVARSVRADLEQEGYRISPTTTGERGGVELVYEVALHAVVTIASDVWQHRDILDTLSSLCAVVAAVSPIARRVLYAKNTRSPATTLTKEHDPEIKVSIKIDGAEIEITSGDLANDARVLQVAQRLLAAHPGVKVTPQSKVSIKRTVKKQQKRRRY